VTIDGRDLPDALLLAWIGFGIVGARDFTFWWCINFEFATAFLTVVTVVMKRETVLASTLVGTNCVPT